MCPPKLGGEQLASYRVLVPDDSKIKLGNFKPFSSGGVSGGFVASKSPKGVDELGAMKDEELWNYLNTWEPKAGYEYDSAGKLQHENIFELAAKFVDLVYILPERFNPASKWWENIKRVEILNKFLDLAADRVSKKQNDKETPLAVPTEDKWAIWFGITGWVMSQSWPRHAAVRFLHCALKSDYVILDSYFPAFPNWLRQLIQEDDARLSGHNSFNDSLTTAINSVRGEAFEALLDLASRQKKAGKQIDPWVFELIRSRLTLQEEAPAIFALFGANLNFVIYLFRQELKESPSLLFPANRPEHRSAAITAHFTYGHPWNMIIEIFPALINDALGVLNAMRVEAADDGAKQNDRDFGSRLGIHIACYYYGLFLGESRRMHPSVCRFISESIYERRLGSHPDCARQKITVPPGAHGLITNETGIVFSGVEHDGDIQQSDEEVERVKAIYNELLVRPYTAKDGSTRPLALEDFLFIAPYNAQVRALQAAFPAAARAGSVDKFQGQQAPVCILSLCSSYGEYGSRGLAFILDRNRINVAISRAQCLAVVVADPRIASSAAGSIHEMMLINLFCKLAESRAAT
jgi:hypothetical protein